MEQLFTRVSWYFIYAIFNILLCTLIQRTEDVFFYGISFCSCDRWWKTKEMPAGQHCRSMVSWSPLPSAQWCHSERSHVQSASSRGGLTWMPLTHLRHLNLQSGGKIADILVHLDIGVTMINENLNKSQKMQNNI